MKNWHLQWDFGIAEIISTAAILKACTFRLPSGRLFAPLACAPWASGREKVDPDLPGHMRHLGGEFVCLPFGVGAVPPLLARRWAESGASYPQPVQHGACADGEWDLVSSSSSHVQLRIDYPKEGDIDFVTRTIRADPAASALDIQVSICARRSTRLPFAFHPIFRLPDRPLGASIHIPFRHGFTYPGTLPPGISPTATDADFGTLRAVPIIGGGHLDLSRLPHGGPMEEFIQLAGVTGEATVEYRDERTRVRLTWDSKMLPSCLLWVSDRSLQEPPWCGRFRGFAIEPAAAAFDLPVEVARGPNPIQAEGSATVLAVHPGQPTMIGYRLAAEEITGT